MAEAYSQGIARVVVAQLAEAAGFEGGLQSSALDTLVDLLLRFIAEGSAGAKSLAELANRSAVNIADLVLTLQDMGTSAKALKQYADFVKQDELPFAQPIAAYPIAKRPRKVPSFTDKEETPPAHLPAFLPAFPDKHTYISTPVFPSQDKDAKRVREKLNKQRQTAAKAVINQHARTTGTEAAKPGAQAPGEAGTVPPGALGLGPFFAAPLWEHAGAEAPRAEEGEAVPSASTSQLMDIDTVQQPLTDPSPSAALATQPVLPTGNAWTPLSQPSHAQPSVGPHIAFDWAKSLQRRAFISSSNLPFEDASKDDDDSPIKASDRTPQADKDKARKRKASAKGAAAKADRDREPAMARAEQLLAAAEAGATGDQAALQVGQDNVEVL